MTLFKLYKIYSFRIYFLLAVGIGVKEDAWGEIQETGQIQRPARMVGSRTIRKGLDSSSYFNGKEDLYSDKKHALTNKTGGMQWNRQSASPLPFILNQEPDPELQKAAEAMESLFLDEVLKTMRQTVPENTLGLDSPAVGIYRSLLDSEYAKKAASRGGVGLANQIVAYFYSRGYHQNHKEKP